MIRHILLFRFNEDTPEVLRHEAVDRLHALGELCPTIGSWSIGLNFADSPSAHDVVEIAEFATVEDLDEYKAHPAHREFSDFIRPLATWALADYEIPHRAGAMIPTVADLGRKADKVKPNPYL